MEVIKYVDVCKALQSLGTEENVNLLREEETHMPSGDWQKG